MWHSDTRSEQRGLPACWHSSGREGTLLLQPQTQHSYLPSTLKIVKCGRQWKEPRALPAQFIHRPWYTQVAVITEDARVVTFHSLDVVAATRAPNPPTPHTRAEICALDMSLSLTCGHSPHRMLWWPRHAATGQNVHKRYSPPERVGDDSSYSHGSKCGNLG